MAVLHLLLLLLVVGGVSTKINDAMCHAWTQGIASPVKSFYCPEDMKFCCGTCATPYCCSAAKAQLDQQQCRQAAPYEVITMISYTIRPLNQEATVGRIMVFLFAMICGAVLLFGLYRCCTKGYREIWRRRRNRSLARAISDYYNRVEEENIDPLDTLDVPPSFFTVMPPYDDDDQESNNSDWRPREDVDYPPPISVAQIHNTADAEAETCFLGHRIVPEAASEANLELESLLKE
ncbi:Hypothetical predicted protein [Podarcis lilfordi]|uniref:Shisa N-terminal domain-containing protein n=1 Tax=Podarcis lilfordi TaxID=74358 RepID=A0AA35LDN0_9SAUR|nr:Hypothetical predicted protein [Podarcis lilfordi]